MFIWILIIIFIWILASMHTSQVDGFKVKKIIKKTTTGITKTANQVGSAVAKIATVGLGPQALMVRKNMGVIKKSIGEFIKKGDDFIPLSSPPKVALVARKCGK